MNKEEVLNFVQKCNEKLASMPEYSIMRFFEIERYEFDTDQENLQLYFTVPEGAMNTIGTTHGGYLVSLLDHWGGVVGRCFAIGKNLPYNGITTADLQIKYMAPTKAGDKLRIEGSCYHFGSRLIIVHLNIFKGNTMVTTSTQSLAIR